MKTMKRFVTALLLAALLVGSLSLTSAEAALKKATGLKFIGWYDAAYTEPAFKWNAVSGAQAYEIRYMYLNNKNITNRYTTATSGYLSGLEGNRIYKVMVRGLAVNSSGKITSRGGWSNTVYTIPMPKTITPSKAGNTIKSGVKMKWSAVKGAHGYTVYMSTNPSGKWYAVKTTAAKQSATSATIKKINGSYFKEGKTYYYRVVARRKVGGKYQTSPLPSKDYYHGSFWWY